MPCVHEGIVQDIRIAPECALYVTRKVFGNSLPVRWAEAEQDRFGVYALMSGGWTQT
jgi:hypothetical protein